SSQARTARMTGRSSTSSRRVRWRTVSESPFGFSRTSFPSSGAVDVLLGGLLSRRSTEHAQVLQDRYQLCSLLGIEHAYRSARRADGTPHEVERGMDDTNISRVAHELANREDPIEQLLRAAEVLLLDAEVEQLDAFARQNIGQARTPAFGTCAKSLKRDRLPAMEDRHLAFSQHADLRDS